MNKIFCVITHTHWDREWYTPFEKFRFKLVDLIDNLIDILEEYPQYIFHLDAQTIVVEDYLEIKPYRKAILEEFIQEGRILVGPWYVQNDFYLTSGEATIRNLIIGSRTAEQMGRCTWVGYTPDQFGLISQLPQIFNSFGMDSCIFARGYSFFDSTEEGIKRVKKPSEFIWKGEDGSEVLAVHMPFWYNNAQRFSEDIIKSIKLLEIIENNFKEVALTPYLLLMNGVDHLEAQENLIPILEELNDLLPEGKIVRQTSMPEYLQIVREYLEKSQVITTMPQYMGELRIGKNIDILQGTLSSRIYLKTANVRAQSLLEGSLEPIYSFISMLGAEQKYPSDFLHYLWKLLLQNHPHDSICGCSRDEIHDHMEDRYSRIFEAGEELLQRGMDFISAHIDRSSLENGDYLITLFNTVETSRKFVVEVELDFPVDEKVSGFSIKDSTGADIDFVLLSKERRHRNLFSPINLPGSKEVDTYKVQLYIDGIQGMSYKVLTVKPISVPVVLQGIKGDKASIDIVKLENEYLTVFIHDDGKIDLNFRQTGKQYKDILYLEDSEDCGDSYIYGKAENGKTYTTKGLIPEIRCISNSDFETKYSLTYVMKLPECFIENTGLRSDKMVENTVEIIVGLNKGCQWLDVDFHINNTSKDHRLRALLATGIGTDFTYASTPFDVIERDRRDVLKKIKDGTQPNSGFVDINNGSEGMAFLNQGIQEYEHLLGNEGIIALTLLRSNGKISVDSEGDTWKAPGNQCLRKICVKMGIYPHVGNWINSEVALMSKEFLNPVLSYYQPVDTTKFVGGRPAVQDSDITEIFYRKDSFAHIVLPHQMKVFDIKGRGVVVSAVKKSENDDSIIIRLYNSTSEESEFELTFFKTLKSVIKVNMKEEAIEELCFDRNTVKTISIKPKEIYTLAVK